MAFNVDEAKAMIAISANLEGVTAPLPLPAIPPDWGTQPIFNSPELGAYKNKWQLWKNQDNLRYAVVIRGTIDNPTSIWEDLMAVMIPATGSLAVNSVSFNYKLAEDPTASVHLGFTLGMAILLYDSASGILTQLEKFCPANGAEILLVGHSQGAAIATLCQSFLIYSDFFKSNGYGYRGYFYAQPKPGNDHYGWDFESLARRFNSPAFCITNTQDWVPQVPLTLQGFLRLNTPNPLSVMTDGKWFYYLHQFLSRLLRWRLKRSHLKKHANQLKILESTLVKQTHTHFGKTAPAASLEIEPTLNFVNCGVPITLIGTPGVNPQIPGDFFWQHHASMYYSLLERFKK